MGGRGSERKDDPTSSSSSVFPTSRYEQRVLRSHYAISPLESALSFDREKRGVGRSGMKFSESSLKVEEFISEMRILVIDVRFFILI